MRHPWRSHGTKNHIYNRKHIVIDDEAYTAEAQSLVDQFFDSRIFSYESSDDDATDDASDNEED
jgi:hypothetical protein